jgi:trimeric autotransporter adhesin
MALTYVAAMPVATLSPAVYLAVGSVSVGLNTQLQGNLALAASLTATPPTKPSELAASASFGTNVAAAVAALPPVPAVSFSASDIVTLNASLNDSLTVKLPALNALLGASAGIFSYGYAGVASSLGASLTTELATQWPDTTPSSGTCTAFIFGAVASQAVTNLAGFLGGVPLGPSLAYAGKLGLSTMCPGVASAAAQGSASIGAAVSAAASLSAPSASFSGMSASQVLFYASVSADVTVAPPTAAIAASTAAAASLSASFGDSCSLGALLADQGVLLFVYSYTGVANALGAALTSALASTWGDGVTPTSGACSVAILGATTAGAITSLTGFFGGA